MLNVAAIFMIISVSILISIALVISIPKYMYLIEYANNTIVLNKIENVACVFSAVCLIFGWFIMIMNWY